MTRETYDTLWALVTCALVVGVCLLASWIALTGEILK